MSNTSHGMRQKIKQEFLDPSLANESTLSSTRMFQKRKLKSEMAHHEEPYRIKSRKAKRSRNLSTAPTEFLMESLKPKTPKPISTISCLAESTRETNTIFTNIRDLKITNPKDELLERKISQNCAKDIRKVDTKIKELKNVLLRIVPTDDKHTYLLPGAPTEMALIPDMLMTYKIPCAGKNAPCIIKFAYGDKYNHVSIFISQTEVAPTEKNCDTKLFSPKMFVVQDKAKGAKFEN